MKLCVNMLTPTMRDRVLSKAYGRLIVKH
jgi:hypothetical protein